MAQRTVHYALGVLLVRRCGVADPGRFLLGSLLPDAYADHGDRDRTHFLDRRAPARPFFDFGAFRARFRDRMDDGLYLGYYMHLVEDALYRRFIHGTYALVTHSPAEVAALHRDYRLMNAYLVQKYALEDRRALPEDLEGEPLLAVAPFDLPGLPAAFASDFVPPPPGETRFLTERMLDEFMEAALPPAAAELEAVRRGAEHLRPDALAWDRRME